MEYQGKEVIKLRPWEYYTFIKVMGLKPDQDFYESKVEFVYITREWFDKWQNYENEIREKIRKIQSWNLKTRRKEFVKVSKYDFYGFYEWCAENNIVEGNALCCFGSYPFTYITAIETYHYKNKRGGYYTYELSKSAYEIWQKEKYEYEDYLEERLVANGFLPYKGALQDYAKRKKEEQKNEETKGNRT